MTRTYKPKGPILKLLEAVQAEPQREFTGPEVCAITGIPAAHLGRRLQPAVRAKLIYRRAFGPGKPAILRATPFPTAVSVPPRSQNWKDGKEQAARGWITSADDLRVPKVDPNWKPPVMRHVRGGA